MALNALIGFLPESNRCKNIGDCVQSRGESSDTYLRREIITVRGQSYVSRLPKYWPPTPLSVWQVCPPPPNKGGGGGGGTHSPGGEGVGVNIFWKKRDIGLPSCSNNLSTPLLIPLLFGWTISLKACWWLWKTELGLHMFYRVRQQIISEKNSAK